MDGEPKDPVEGTEYPHPVIQVDTTQFAKLSIHKAWIATTIDYRPRVNGEPQDLVEGTEYPHPVIQVDTTQFANLSIHKAWIATNPEPDKVTVDVTCKDAAGGECTGYPGIDISKSSNWTSTVLIPKADADRTYTVTEHALSGDSARITRILRSRFPPIQPVNTVRL